MFCTKCGASCEENAKFCASCGNAMQPQVPQQPVYQPPQQPQQPVYQPPVYQQPVYQAPYYQNQPLTEQYQLPMKWFKFLIYFSLFAGALLNVVSAIPLLTGSVYEGAADLVYAMFEGLQAVDMLAGILMLATAVVGVYARFRLAKYCQNGPKMLTVLYIMAAAINLFYLIGVSAVLPEGVMESVDTTSSITSIVTSVIMIFVNRTYFQKRAHLFVN